MTDGEAGSIGKLLIEVSEELANMRRAHGDEVARAVAEERAAVVAMLRGYANSWGVSPDEKRVLHWAISRVQHGKHRREGQP